MRCVSLFTAKKVTDRFYNYVLQIRTELFKFWVRKRLWWLKLPRKEPLEPTSANKNADEAAEKVSALAAWSMLCVQFIFHLIMAPFMRPEYLRVGLNLKASNFLDAQSVIRRRRSREFSQHFDPFSQSAGALCEKGKERERAACSLPGPSRSLARPPATAIHYKILSQRSV